MQTRSKLRFPIDPDIMGLLDYGILIIDDQQDSADLIHALLDSHGFRNLRVAHSGEQGLELLAEDNRVGLVLLDILMPKMDGYEVCERINNNPQWSSIPVIMVTGGGLLQNEALRHSFRSGAMDYISKPINEIELFARVTVALKLYRERQQRKLDSKLIEDSRERLRHTMELAPIAITHLDAQGVLLSVSARFCELFSQTEEQLLGQYFENLYFDAKVAGRASWSELSDACNRGTTQIREGLRLRGGEKTKLDVNLALTAIKDPSGQLRYFIATMELAAAQERVVEMSGQGIDQLTGLINREQFTRNLNQNIFQATEHCTGLSVMFIDLDNFKQVNDSLGHRLGDLLIEQASQRVAACTQAQDVELGRLGGDEFGLLLRGESPLASLEELASQILQAFTKPLLANGREIIITVSIGISCYPMDGEDAHTLMQAADTAMYQAKDRGRNNLIFYHADMASLLNERLYLEQFLRRAIEKNELRLLYQPQCSIQDGRLLGAEVLLRWQHPQKGLLNPEEFIPLAEDTGLILEIGQWVLSKACDQIALWQESAEANGTSMVPIMVNLSLIQMRTREIISVLADVLNSTGINPDYLGIELTENIGEIDVDEVVEMLHSLHRHGVQIALDDFGSGYSSLSRIKRFPLDLLKIDKDFIKEIHEDDDSLTIVRAIIAMAHALNLKVVAEGVENTSQLEALRGLDCDIAQGYLFGRAMEAKQFKQLLDNDSPLRQLAQQG